MLLQDWMQYLTGLPADVGAIPLLVCATKDDLPGAVSAMLYAFVSVPVCQLLMHESLGSDVHAILYQCMRSVLSVLGLACRQSHCCHLSLYKMNVSNWACWAECLDLW